MISTKTAFLQILTSVAVTMEDVLKTVTTTLGATPVHATLDMLRMGSMDVLVYRLHSHTCVCFFQISIDLVILTFI